MGKGKAKKLRGGKKARGLDSAMNQITRQAGKSYMSLSMVSSIRTLDVTPHIDVRIESLADLFELYRFTRLKWILNPGWQTTTDTALRTYGAAIGMVCTGYDEISEPDNFAEICELPFSTVNQGGMTVQTHFEVSRTQLARNPVKWFQYGTQTDSMLEVQGILYLAGQDPTLVVTGILEWEIEFTNPVPAEVTMRRALFRDEAAMSLKRLRPNALSKKYSDLKKRITVLKEPEGEVDAAPEESRKLLIQKLLDLALHEQGPSVEPVLVQRSADSG